MGVREKLVFLYTIIFPSFFEPQSLRIECGRAGLNANALDSFIPSFFNLRASELSAGERD